MATSTTVVNEDYLQDLIASEERLRAENEKLRAALANSELPCVYCTLPKEEWGKCEMGFPGCGRADDAMGCPELGARMEADGLRDSLAAVTAERDRMREVVKRADSYIHNGIELGFIRHCDTPEDPAYHTPRIVREAARAALEGVTESATGDSNA